MNDKTMMYAAVLSMSGAAAAIDGRIEQIRLRHESADLHFHAQIWYTDLET